MNTVMLDLTDATEAHAEALPCGKTSVWLRDGDTSLHLIGERAALTSALMLALIRLHAVGAEVGA